MSSRSRRDCVRGLGIPGGSHEPSASAAFAAGTAASAFAAAAAALGPPPHRPPSGFADFADFAAFADFADFAAFADFTDFAERESGEAGAFAGSAFAGRRGDGWSELALSGDPNARWRGAAARSASSPAANGLAPAGVRGLPG